MERSSPYYGEAYIDGDTYNVLAFDDAAEFLERVNNGAHYETWFPHDVIGLARATLNANFVWRREPHSD